MELTTEVLDTRHFPFLEKIKPDKWQNYLASFEFYIYNSFCVCWIFKLDEKYVGTGTVILFEDSAWLAHIIVDQSHQKKGIGTRITQKLIQFCHKENIHKIQLLATDDGEKVYKKLGFKPHSRQVFYGTHPLTSFSDRELGFVPLTKEWIPEVFRLDQTSTGENRSELLKTTINHIYIKIENGKLIAFKAPNLGRGLMISTDPDFGVEMLKQYCNQHSILVFPEGNETALNFATKYKLQYFRSAQKMYFTTPAIGRSDWIYGRVGGNMG